MKKLVFTVVLMMSAAAFAGGNEIMTKFGDQQLIMQLQESGVDMSALMDSAKLGGVIVGPVIGGPIDPGPGVPGGNDGQWTNDVTLSSAQLDTIVQQMGNLQQGQIAEITLPGGNCGGSNLFVAQPGDSGGGSGLTINSVKFLAETETSVITQINHQSKVVGLDDEYLSVEKDVANALNQSVKTGDWVDFK